MSPTSDQPGPTRKQYTFNLALAAVAGQVGCLTLAIILVALIGGLWLDSLFQSRPLFTVVLMIASVPVTLVAMFLAVRATTSRIKPGSQQSPKVIEEEADSGKTT